MKNEMTMKEKRFGFFANPQEEKRKADPQCTHLQKSAILQTQKKNYNLKIKE